MSKRLVVVWWEHYTTNGVHKTTHMYLDPEESTSEAVARVEKLPTKLGYPFIHKVVEAECEATIEQHLTGNAHYLCRCVKAPGHPAPHSCVHGDEWGFQ